MRRLISALRAARAYSFPASTVPVLVGAAGAVLSGPFGLRELAWLVVTWTAATLLHAGCNLVNDYFDWQTGVDDAHVLRSSWVANGNESQMARVHAAGLLCLGLGASIGLLIAVQRSWTILLIGAAGVAIAYFYTARPLGLKYRALGELSVFLGMGPLMVLGAFAAIRGGWTGDWAFVFAVSVPVGLMVTAILYANNLRDLRNDAAKSFRTLPILLGPRLAPLLYYGLVGVAYAAPVALTLLTWTVWWLAPLLSAPLEWRIARRIRAGFPDRPEQLRGIDVACAQTDLAYGLLMVLAIVLVRLTRPT